MTAARERRRQRLADFAHQLYVVRDVGGAFGRFVCENYVQHSPGLPDGRAAAVRVLTEKFADPALHLSVRHILLDGDLAVLLIHGEIARPPAAPERFTVVDIYRLEGDLIVEHWDVKQEFPGVVANDHPFFS